MAMNRLRQIAASLASIFAWSNTLCNTNAQNEYPFLETVSYNANNPIEDRFCYTKLKSIEGFTASVFDGHGGDLVVL
jgi:hypothetical protein